MTNKKFINIPGKSYFLIQLALLLPTPFLFCFFANHPLPGTFLEGLIDLGAIFITLISSIPIMLLSMVVLKIFFYGSVMGTKRRVSLNTKNKLTILFIVVSILPASIFQAELFLWLTSRVNSTTYLQLLSNACLIFLAGLPSFLFSLKDLKKKMDQAKKHQ